MCTLVTDRMEQKLAIIRRKNYSRYGSSNAREGSALSRPAGAKHSIVQVSCVALDV